jgi:hypothetical protein
VGHVHKEVGSDGVGDGAHPFEVDDARVGAGAGGDHLGFDLQRGLGKGVVINALVLFGDAVVDDVKEAA